MVIASKRNGRICCSKKIRCESERSADVELTGGDSATAVILCALFHTADKSCRQPLIRDRIVSKRWSPHGGDFSWACSVLTHTPRSPFCSFATARLRSQADPPPAQLRRARWAG